MSRGFTEIAEREIEDIARRAKARKEAQLKLMMKRIDKEIALPPKNV